MKLLEIDSRSLGLFRIGLGLVLLYYFLSHAGVIDEFHTDDGALSRQALREYYGPRLEWSFNWINRDSRVLQWVLWSIGVLSALSLLVGFRTRLCTVVNWILVVSFNNNAPLIVGGGDILLAMLLFWSVFLPLDIRWSIGCSREPGYVLQTYEKLAALAIQLQMAMMYFFSGVSKWNSVWKGGTALSIALSNDRLIRPPGAALREYPLLCATITVSTLVLELALPFVLFSPWKTTICRTFSLLILVGLHVGIETTMVVMLFSFSSLVGLTIFVPALWWEHFPLRSIQNLLDQWSPPMPTVVTSRSERKKLARAQRTANANPKTVDWIASTAIVACLIYVIGYNVLASFIPSDKRRNMAGYQRFGELTALKQHWNMFSDPSPLNHEVACIARLGDGQYVDLLRDAVEVDDPKSPPTTPVEYANPRWMICTTALTYPENLVFCPSLVRYLATSNTDLTTIKEAHLIYYPFGSHPYASKVRYMERFHLDLRATGTYIAGLRHGPWELRNDEGVVVAKGDFRQGRPDGYWVFWNNQGIKISEGQMAGGERVGTWKNYDVKGSHTETDKAASP